MAHVRQPRPNSGPEMQLEVLEPLKLFSSRSKVEEHQLPLPLEVRTVHLGRSTCHAISCRGVSQPSRSAQPPSHAARRPSPPRPAPPPPPSQGSQPAQFRNDYLKKTCSGSVAGSYSRYPSTLCSTVKKEKNRSESQACFFFFFFFTLVQVLEGP